MNRFWNLKTSPIWSISLGTLICAVLANLATAAPRHPANGSATTLAPFQGVWEAVSYSQDGVADDGNTLRGTNLRVEGDHSTFTRGGRTLHGRYVVDDAKYPRTLDIVDIRAANGSEADVILRGIYEFDGDYLRVAISDATRPADFEPRKGVRIEVWRHADHEARQIVRENARRLMTAYDNQNMEGILAAFEPNATRIDTAGHVLLRRETGHEALHRIYQDQFARYPGARLEIQTGSATLVSPDVIVADGTARLTSSSDEHATPARWFRVLHRGKDAGWRISVLQINFPEK